MVSEAQLLRWVEFSTKDAELADLARELLAARQLIEAMRKRKDTECEFGTGCTLPEYEDSECDWCAIRRLLTAYDAATKGE